MKKLFLTLLCTMALCVRAQDATEREIKTEVNAVTVYLENALETRKASVDVSTGKTLLRFVNLSPFIDAKSIQAKVDGDVTVLSVNHQQNFDQKTEVPAQVTELQGKIKEVNKKIGLEKTYLMNISADLAFLRENRDLGGEQSVSMAAVREGADFFSTRFSALKLKELERRYTLQELQKDRANLVQQLQNFGGEKVWSTGEVQVLVEAKKPVSLKVELTCLVSNAGWYPSYDIRANNISEPLQVIYKANIHQDTKSDWRNVKIRLSSYNPTVSGVVPMLKTYYLGSSNLPPVYESVLSSVSGRVTDWKNNPIAGVQVRVNETNMATVTDQRGCYSITLPANQRNVTFTRFGYYKVTKYVTNETTNMVLSENRQALLDVMTTSPSFGAEEEMWVESEETMTVKGTDEVTGVDIADLEDHKVVVEEKTTANYGAVKARGTSSMVQQTQIEKPISVDFEVETPYTVLSNNKVVAVDMKQLELPAVFQYYAVPKRNNDVFLTANVKDWEKFNFLEGEANVFFEDTYVGKTLLDVDAAKDTLQISLGRDKKISIQREKVKSLASKQFISNKNIEVREWKTTVRNGRTEKINLMLVDQVPVSTDVEIEVDAQMTPEAPSNSATGEVIWEQLLNPGQTKIFNLKYTVKYPKGNKMFIE